MEKIFFYLSALLVAYSCTNSKGTAPRHHLKWGRETDSLLNDTAHVSKIVDSLKLKVLNASDDTSAINSINQLAFNWRKATPALTAEAMRQSELINYPYGRIDAFCRLGYNFRRSGDNKSADSVLSKAVTEAKSHGFKKLEALGSIMLGEAKLGQRKFDEALSVLNNALEITKQTNDKSNMAFCYNILGEVFRMQREHEKAIGYYNKAILIAKEIDDKSRMANCFSVMGDIYHLESDFEKALDYLGQSLKIATELNEKARIAFCSSVLASIYTSQGDYQKAVENINRSYEIAREGKDKLKMAEILKTYAYLYRTQKEDEKALDKINQAIELFREIDNERNVASCYNLLGEIYHDRREPGTALSWYLKALEISRKFKDKNSESYTLSSIADVYGEQKRYKEALDMYNQSLEISREQGDAENMCYCLRAMSDILLLQGDLKKAKEYGEQAFQLARDGLSIYDVKDVTFTMYRIYNALQLPEKALGAFELFVQSKDSISSEEQIRKFTSAEYTVKEEKLKTEQQSKERVFKAEQALKEEEIKAQKRMRNFFIGGSAILALLAFIIYRSLQQNKKDKAVIQEQKALVEEKQKEILDSISYAKRLQEAILPPVSLVKKHLPESFILYKPKDIVAGDFYWMHIDSQKIYFAAADCTGHGVPGAMVSVVCSNALNQAVKEFGLTEPGKILDKVRELVIETFEKSESEVKDGMDISLVSIPRSPGSSSIDIEWSGANNPLWYISNGAFHKIAPNKQPIGKFAVQTSFTSHTVTLNKGAILYLFTDGYADQFGGPGGKKLKYKSLQDYLVEISALDVETQKEILNEKLSAWRGNLEQVDDVCIIGIRL